MILALDPQTRRPPPVHQRETFLEAVSHLSPTIAHLAVEVQAAG